MINYYKNKLIDECLIRYYETFACTLDTADFVPEKFNNKILSYIFKCERRTFRQINRENRRKQREIAQRYRQKKRQLRREEKARNKETRQDAMRLQGANDGQERVQPRYFPTPFDNIPSRKGEISA